MQYRKQFTKFGTAQYFQTPDDLYKQRFNYFVALASRHLANKNEAVDVVHAAFAKTLEYLKEHPDKKIREHIVAFRILKICKKLNKRHNIEVSFGVLNGDNDERSDD